VVAALGRTARICADDYDFLQAALDAAWPALAAERPGEIELRRSAWIGLHPALRRYALRRAAAQLAGAELSFALVEAARAAIDAGHASRMPLSRGLLLEISSASAHIRVAGAPAQTTAPQLRADRSPIAAPGRTPIGDGWECVVQPGPPPLASPWWVAIPADLAGDLTLRRRRPGDRFRPAGGRGTRRLQDFFVDRKVSQRLRDAWPILVAGDAILWVAGLRADERARSSAGPVLWVGLVHNEEGQGHAR
jgi:tRNA(Ile)-lysidine synthase